MGRTATSADEPGAGSQVIEHLAQCELGEPAGDEEDAGRRCLSVGSTPILPSVLPSGKCSSHGPAVDPHDLPVRNSAAGLTRKQATRATSSGVPQRARGVSRRTRSCQASEAVSPHEVLIQPGARALTRTSGARLSARLRVKARTAPLVAAKSSPESPSMPVSAWSQPIVRIEPRPWDFIRRPTARQRRIVATTSTDQSRSSLASKDSFAAAPVRVSAPAMWSQASRPPQSPRRPPPGGRRRRDRRGRPCRTCGSAPLDRRLARDLLGRLRSSVARARSRRRPASARARAAARPIPDVEPRTAALMPRRSNLRSTDRHGGAEK